MKPSLALLGLLGGGVYLFTKKPVTKKTDKKDTKPAGEKPSDNKDLPNIDEEDEDDLPDVDDKETEEEEENDQEAENEASDEEIKANTIALMEKYYDPYFLTGIEGPANVNNKKIWISNDCLNWGIRKGYDFSLPEKYLYPVPVNPDKLTTPSQYWDKIGDDMTPTPWYINDYPVDTPPAAISAQLIDYYSPCDISAPRRKQFKTYGEYKIVRQKFAQTPLGKLFEYLVETIGDTMFDSWAKKYPDQAELELFKGWALKAIRNNPKITDAGKLTDIAYALIFGGMPEAPKKIDPKNPNHKYYLDAWMRINIEVKNYKGLIKQYGLD